MRKEVMEVCEHLDIAISIELYPRIIGDIIGML